MRHHIIPIFIPHLGCTNHCIFCNQHKITGVTTTITAAAVRSVIKEHMNYAQGKSHIEVAFYGGSFTALPMEVQSELLAPASEAYCRNQIHSIRISTRPDCLNESIISNLKRNNVGIVELGAQSLEDEILKKSLRGHLAADVSKAVHMLKAAGLKCGLQLMVGLPGETFISLICSTNKAVGLKPDFARIYPTLVIANSPLALEYQAGNYQPLTMEDAISYSAYMKLSFEINGIPVIRTGLQATEELGRKDVVLAGPYHPAFGEMVDAHIFYLLVARYLETRSRTSASIVIHHYPKDHSKLRGLNSGNIKRWFEKYGVTGITFIPDGNCPWEIVIEDRKLHYFMNKYMLFWI